jgi:hypothetical protein
MAADRSRLAAALAYRQAEEERRRRMLESIPTPAGTTPAQPAPQADFRTNLENLSIGVGEGLTNQLEGIKGIVTDPVGTAKGVYEAGKAVVRDPAIIASALRQMGQKAMSGPLGAGEVIGEMLGPRKTGPVMAELDVYHGTPHRFPATEANPLGEFDASKIGTGEGAQAYGHGVYLAENPGVARSYIKTPEDWAVQANVKGSAYRKAQAEMTKIERELRQKNNAKIPKDEISAFMYAEKNADKFDSKLMERIRAVRQAEEKAYKDFSAGSFYKADLPDEMIDRMLDWDKPLSEQPAAVREALLKNPVVAEEVKRLNAQREALNAQNPKRLSHPVIGKLAQKETTTESLKGQALYELLARGNTQAETSAYLKSLGIPGIKYLDAGSRGQGGTGTRNFVVFPGEEKKVRILERK